MKKFLQKTSGKKNDFFKEIKPETNIEKANVPENTLLYINQGVIFTVKSGELAM